jgi:hypothetical protein
MAASVITFIPSGGNQSESAIKEQLNKAKKLVTEGRYLITVFEAPNDWESHLPIEAFVISETLGGIHDRSTDWEFFGNGVIRTYTSKALRLSKAYQWTIVRRSGDKPYARRSSLSAATLKRNTIPVADKVFTRDVANNVWHLLNDNFKERVITRFSTLLTWQDEDFFIVEPSKTSEVKDRKALVLKEDLVGVPNKVPYFWDNGEVLF